MEEYSIKTFFENLTNNEIEKEVMELLFEDLSYETIVEKLILKGLIKNDKV